jgi:1-acyl-sn-glycerol-3-phosphate acyltransferase
MLADTWFGLVRAYATSWMRSRCRVLLQGEENLPADPTRPRVYIVINHSTTFDLVALVHIAAQRFSAVVDGGAFQFPVVGSILRAAGFIPLDKSDSAASLSRAVQAAAAGIPLIMSLTDGAYAVGGEGRPRTGGIRIAHQAGADLYPLFTMVENDMAIHRSFKGRGGHEHPYTTFRDAFYAISFLPPILAGTFSAAETYESYRARAEALKNLAARERERFTQKLRDEAASLQETPRRGGCDHRVRY